MRAKCLHLLRHGLRNRSTSGLRCAGHGSRIGHGRKYGLRHLSQAAGTGRSCEGYQLLKRYRDPRLPDYLAAWTLDKYKKFHIVEKAWAMKPDMDWYLHIDTDTYVIWPSLVAWLEQLDSSKESFLGSLSYIDNLPFAHGGSGMLMSGAAMRNFAVTHNGTASRWDNKMQKECCGDWVLARF